MLGCKNIPLVRSIFGLDERSSYKRAPVYFAERASIMFVSCDGRDAVRYACSAREL